MPYYLAPYIGSGKRFDPCRPIGSEQLGWSAIDLRPDGGATPHGSGLNACLLYLPQHDPNRRLYQLASQESEAIGPQQRHHLCHRLGFQGIRSKRFDDLVVELMVHPPTHGWGPARVDHLGRLNVHLGPLHRRQYTIAALTHLALHLRAAAEIAGVSLAAILMDPSPWLLMLGIIITENWNCGDSTSITCQHTWTEVVTTGWNLTTNTARFTSGSGANYGVARCETALATDDHYAQVIAVNYNASTNFGETIEVMCRVAPSGADPNRYMYYGRQELDVSVDEHRLAKRVSGVETQLGSSDPADVADGETLYVEANGDQIKGKLNGVTSVGPITDTAIVDNLRAGISSYIGINGDITTFDSFEAADITSSASITPVDGILAAAGLSGRNDRGLFPRTMVRGN